MSTKILKTLQLTYTSYPHGTGDEWRSRAVAAYQVSIVAACSAGAEPLPQIRAAHGGCESRSRVAVASSSRRATHHAGAEPLRHRQAGLPSRCVVEVLPHADRWGRSGWRESRRDESAAWRDTACREMRKKMVEERAGETRVLVEEIRASPAGWR